MSYYLRKLWKKKPNVYGPFPVVQKNIFNNLEKIGINPQNLIFGHLNWGPGDQVDYSSNKNTGVNNNSSSFLRNRLDFSTGNEYISIPGANLPTDLSNSSFTQFMGLSFTTTSNLVISEKGANILFMQTFTGGVIRYGLRAGNLRDSIASFNDGKINHIAFYHDDPGDLIGLIANGVLDSIQSSVTGVNTSVAFNFGSRAGSFGFGGEIEYSFFLDKDVNEQQGCILTEDFYRIIYRNPEKSFFLPPSVSQNIISIQLSDNIASFSGKKINSGVVNSRTANASLANAGNEGLNAIKQALLENNIIQTIGLEGLNSIIDSDLEDLTPDFDAKIGKLGNISIDIDFIIQILGFESAVVFTGIIDSTLIDNVLNVSGNKGLNSEIKIQVENIMSIFNGVKGNQGSISIDVFTGIELIGKLGLKGIWNSQLEDLELILIEIVKSERIFRILISTKTGQIRILSPKTGNINITTH